MFSRDHGRGLLVYAAALAGEGLPDRAIERVLDGYELALASLPAQLAELLPDAPKARATDPATAQAAAVQTSGRRMSQPLRILQTLEREWWSAMTAEEVADRTGMPLNSASTRLSELLKSGCVEERGQKRTRNGALATTYLLTIIGENTLFCATRKGGDEDG